MLKCCVRWKLHLEKGKLFADVGPDGLLSSDGSFHMPSSRYNGQLPVASQRVRTSVQADRRGNHVANLPWQCGVAQRKAMLLYISTKN